MAMRYDPISCMLVIETEITKDAKAKDAKKYSWEVTIINKGKEEKLGRITATSEQEASDMLERYGYGPRAFKFSNKRVASASDEKMNDAFHRYNAKTKDLNQKELLKMSLEELQKAFEQRKGYFPKRMEQNEIIRALINDADKIDELAELTGNNRAGVEAIIKEINGLSEQNKESGISHYFNNAKAKKLARAIIKSKDAKNEYRGTGNITKENAHSVMYNLLEMARKADNKAQVAKYIKEVKAIIKKFPHGADENVVSFSTIQNKLGQAEKMLKTMDAKTTKGSVVLPNSIRNKANAITAKYSKWLLPKELQNMYNELEKIGVSVGLIHGDASHGPKYAEVYYNGKQVDNTRFVYSMYKGQGDNLKNEYNIYFS